MGLKLTTDSKPVKVYAKERTSKAGNSYTTYSIMTSSKDKDGNFVNGFLDVQFSKDVKVLNKSKIEILDAFPLVSEYEGKTYIKWYIKEFKVVEEGKAPEANYDFVNVSNDEDLPFAQPSR